MSNVATRMHFTLDQMEEKTGYFVRPFKLHIYIASNSKIIVNNQLQVMWNEIGVRIETLT